MKQTLFYLLYAFTCFATPPYQFQEDFDDIQEMLTQLNGKRMRPSLFDDRYHDLNTKAKVLAEKYQAAELPEIHLANDYYALFSQYFSCSELLIEDASVSSRTKLINDSFFAVIRIVNGFRSQLGILSGEKIKILSRSDLEKFRGIKDIQGKNIVIIPRGNRVTHAYAGVILSKLEQAMELKELPDSLFLAFEMMKEEADSIDQSVGTSDISRSVQESAESMIEWFDSIERELKIEIQRSRVKEDFDRVELLKKLNKKMFEFKILRENGHGISRIGT